MSKWETSKAFLSFSLSMSMSTGSSRSGLGCGRLSRAAMSLVCPLVGDAGASVEEKDLDWIDVGFCVAVGTKFEVVSGRRFSSFS